MHTGIFTVVTGVCLLVFVVPQGALRHTMHAHYVCNLSAQKLGLWGTSCLQFIWLFLLTPPMGWFWKHFVSVANTRTDTSKSRGRFPEHALRHQWNIFWCQCSWFVSQMRLTAQRHAHSLRRGPACPSLSALMLQQRLAALNGHLHSLVPFWICCFEKNKKWLYVVTKIRHIKGLLQIIKQKCSEPQGTSVNYCTPKHVKKG